MKIKSPAQVSEAGCRPTAGPRATGGKSSADPHTCLGLLISSWWESLQEGPQEFEERSVGDALHSLTPRWEMLIED